MKPLLPLLLALALLPGCASTRPGAFAPPRTLGDVNDALLGRRVSLVLVGGATHHGVTDVYVDSARTTFRPAPRNAIETLPTARVQRIEGRTGGKRAGNGALIGAAPGLVIAGLGLVGLAAADDGSWDELGAAAAVVGGGLLAATGAGVGALIGSAFPAGEVVTFYEGPVERYLSPVP